jgi:hypothetical protein
VDDTWSVHNETAANPLRWQTGFMQLQLIKAIIAVVWVLAAVGIMVGSDHLTVSDRLTLGFLAVVPPVAMWFWFNDPIPTTSENIHEARDVRPGPHQGGTAEVERP